MLADLAPESGNVNTVLMYTYPFIILLGLDPFFKANCMNGPEVTLAGAHNHKRVLFIVLRIKANPTKLTDISIPRIVDSIHLG
jgi:hypothetical protein